jgi:haloalkane dehalogenase
MDHYRRAQPTREARVGVAEFPRQIVAAGDFLGQLAEDVPAKLGGKRTLIVWPMEDRAFTAKKVLPRVRVVVELRKARHYFQEDAAEEVAAAIRERFPPESGHAG